MLAPWEETAESRRDSQIDPLSGVADAPVFRP